MTKYMETKRGIDIHFTIQNNLPILCLQASEKDPFFSLLVGLSLFPAQRGTFFTI